LDDALKEKNGVLNSKQANVNALKLEQGSYRDQVTKAKGDIKKIKGKLGEKMDNIDGQKK
jgi:hypothetical protein